MNKDKDEGKYKDRDSWKGKERYRDRDNQNDKDKDNQNDRDNNKGIYSSSSQIKMLLNLLTKIYQMPKGHNNLLKLLIIIQQ